jgi:hypothetical protein
MPVCRRMRGKQTPFVNPMIMMAVADEAWSELTALSADARRKHVHWTHVRTNDPSLVQPSALTREEFYLHLVRVYKEAYPEPANKTGSILLFAAVAKEHHAESSQSELREEHHHGPTYTSKQHYWNVVAKISLEKYKIKLHASTHDCYTSMFAYIKNATTKKPLSELDPEVYLSPEHPRGDVLRRLLEAGARSSKAYQGRQKRTSTGDASNAPKRVRGSDVYQIVRTTGIRYTLALQAHAEKLSQDGDQTLAEFCTSYGTIKLQDHLDAAWAVLGAPKRLEAPASRIGKLRECAMNRSCACGGVWKQGAAFVLANNGECPKKFGRDVCRALAIGARRGVHIAIIGEPGSGKSMILQPLEMIFKTMPPPEDGSTFPLASLLEAEIVLWQDYEYNQKTLNFNDLLRMAVGEKIGVRIPGSINSNFNNSAPIFYSALQRITPPRWAEAYDKKVIAINDRFTVREWSNPLPHHRRQNDFPHCAPCFASFILDNDAAWQTEFA